jgi:uncharacterized protein YdeI (YjbR/CyaY-like superfamily)
MVKKDPRVDAYIAKSADFAKPVLRHIRTVVHDACPDVEETLKWSMPAFMYKGILCGMAAFKQHCTFGFWKHALLMKNNSKNEDAMGQFGRITSIKDLPSEKVLASLVKKAMELNEDGAKVPAKAKKPKQKLIPHPDFISALKKNKKAFAVYENFTYSHKKEYVEWINEAKRDETRERRIATAIEWISQGKSKDWKYMNC